MSGPKGAQGKWLTVVPIIIPEHVLASKFSPHHKFLLQSPCWHPGSSQLLLPSSIPQTPAHEHPFPQLLTPIWPCHFVHSHSQFFLSGSLASSLFSSSHPPHQHRVSWPSPGCTSPHTYNKNPPHQPYLGVVMPPPLYMTTKPSDVWCLGPYDGRENGVLWKMSSGNTSPNPQTKSANKQVKVTRLKNS